VRLKVPDADEESMGWRVEFRPMEVQLTDFANAAFLVFLALLRQVLGSWGEGLDLWMPMSMVRENMVRAQRRDAVTEERFWFPGNAFRRDGSHQLNGTAGHSPHSEPVLMTIREIVNGSADHNWPGLLPLVEQYFTEKGQQDWLPQLDHYLSFIRRRATGEARTPARWMRDVVRSHKAYRHDSVVSPEICYDLMREVAEISS
jgi:glutamate--cysteine ligase catalytic subunit